ncbi:site-specific DNA-methyltransferase [Mesorhizobium sp. 131-2-1]|nr:site-specific DNA-methyltransferase [Mesorhizobium sp. 131-2-1]
MGSKAGIIDFVVDGISRAHRGGPVCDLFAGACSLSGAIGNQVDVISNDIQSYSQTIAHIYLHAASGALSGIDLALFLKEAKKLVGEAIRDLPSGLDYPSHTSLEEFNKIEDRNRQLIDHHFDSEYHLFLRCYSGTWWSAQQCAWIDALRAVADDWLARDRIGNGDHAILLSCVMHAMAYTGQGTGHYAQYRDAKTVSSMKDINIYRQKSVATYFERKLRSIIEWNTQNVLPRTHEITVLDYSDCLKKLDGGTVYADPPYAFVHYSRFYHAIETFVLYDYPDLQIQRGEVVKGRYRDERHQSPFSIRSLVGGAFTTMFEGVRGSGANLVLSYSNAALLDLDTMIELAHLALGAAYDIEIFRRDHRHMTMGRKADRNRDVEETLLLAMQR